MYNFLKPLLKAVGYVPPEKKEKVKTRVILYVKHSNYYVPQYKKWGIWWNFKEAIIFDSMETTYYWNVDQPKLDKDFDLLVKFCQQFKKYNDIRQYHQNDKINFYKTKRDFNAKKSKPKFWESE